MRDLHTQRIALAVATAKSRRGINNALAATGLAQFISWSRTPEECRPKPDPQMVDELVLEAGVEKSRTLLVGDTTHDLAMGQNAGVSVVALAHGAHTVQELAALRPMAVCANIAELRHFLLPA